MPASRPPREARPTPTGVWILDHTWRERVTYVPRQQIVVMRTVRDGVHEVLDVSAPFVEMARLGWVRIEPYELDFPPLEVLCRLTPAGENVLAEAKAAARAKTTGKRKAGTK